MRSEEVYQIRDGKSNSIVASIDFIIVALGALFLHHKLDELVVCEELSVDHNVVPRPCSRA